MGNSDWVQPEGTLAGALSQEQRKLEVIVLAPSFQAGGTVAVSQKSTAAGGQPWSRATVPTSLGDCILYLPFRSWYVDDFHVAPAGVFLHFSGISMSSVFVCVWFLFCLVGFWW